MPVTSYGLQEGSKLNWSCDQGLNEAFWVMYDNGKEMEIASPEMSIEKTQMLHKIY